MIGGAPAEEQALARTPLSHTELPMFLLNTNMLTEDTLQYHAGPSGNKLNLVVV